MWGFAVAGIAGWLGRVKELDPLMGLSDDPPEIGGAATSARRIVGWCFTPWPAAVASGDISSWIEPAGRSGTEEKQPCVDRITNAMQTVTVDANSLALRVMAAQPSGDAFNGSREFP